VNGRLGWLDALRGIAAVLVVFDHLTAHVLQHVRSDVYQVFDPGLYGVCVFFLVSGYIVPASLERTGSVRRFWVSRMFRLYPLFLVAIASLFVLNWAGLAGFRDANRTPVTSVLAHLLMLNDLLGVPDVINVLWTLSYEMVFYLLLTALFVFRVHRRSERYALGFAAVALLLGGLLPMAWLSQSALGGRRVALAADVLVIGGLALALSGRRVPGIVGALTAAGTAMVLLTFNGGQAGPYEGFTILALMFTGTMLYRAERGEFSMPRAIAIAVAVFAIAMAAGAWHLQARHGVALLRREWITSLALAGVTFGAGMALRHRTVPLALAWLGLVSYSVYLLHPLLVDVYTQLPWTRHQHALGRQLLLSGGFLVVLLACCALTYYLVEAPMQRLGRRVARALSTRPGPAGAEHPAANSPLIMPNGSAGTLHATRISSPAEKPAEESALP